MPILCLAGATRAIRLLPRDPTKQPAQQRPRESFDFKNDGEIEKAKNEYRAQVSAFDCEYVPGI